MMELTSLLPRVTRSLLYVSFSSLSHSSSRANSESLIDKSEVPSLKQVHSIPLPPTQLCDTLAWHPSKYMLAYGAGDAFIWGLGV